MHVLHCIVKDDILEYTIVGSLPNFLWTISDKICKLLAHGIIIVVIQHKVTGPGSQSSPVALTLCFITQERRSAKTNPCAKFPQVY